MAKMAEARAGLNKMATQAAAEQAAPAAPRVVAPAAVKPPADPAAVTADGAKPPAKVEADEGADEQTAKGLEAIERRDKRQREQLAADRKAFADEAAQQRAEFAKLKADFEGKTTELDELRKLARAPGKSLELLKRLGVESEDDFERYARDTYAVSKTGKVDPKNKQYADQMAEKQGTASEISDLRKELTDLREQLTTRDRQQNAKVEAERWVDEGIKALPKEPTFIGKTHAVNPTKARSELLATGQAMLREAIEENGGRYDASLEPTHAQVIARYETNKRQALKDDGITDEQIAAMLKPVGAPVAKKPVGGRTLDVATSGMTTNPAPLTRKEKMAVASEGLRKMFAEG